MKIKKGDTVLIITGKDRGKKGKVLQALPKDNKVSVEGVNILKKHVRAKDAKSKGQVVEFPAPIHVSNVKFFHSKCKGAARLGEKKGERFCKNCKEKVS